MRCKTIKEKIICLWMWTVYFYYEMKTKIRNKYWYLKAKYITNRNKSWNKFI